MTETDTRVPEQEEQKKPAAQPQQLSPRRRTALVTYLAILFAAAFLFVAIVMVLETKKLKTINEELQSSSQKTSASLTNNINALQQENQSLSAENEKLQSRIGELVESAALQDEALAELQQQLNTAATEQADMEQQIGELQQRLEEARQNTQDAVRVSELLHQLMAADEDGDMEKVRELLDEIEPLADLLSETERDIYEELKIA
jgi:chromosome segregation ATPase